MMRSILCLLVLTVLSTHPHPALAQSFIAGFTKYQKGDFNGAIQSFRSALVTTRDLAEKAKILKFLGISQHMTGDKQAAIGSFREAIKISSNLTIIPNEVLDESVISIFDTQKRLAASTTLSQNARGREQSPPKASPRSDHQTGSSAPATGALPPSGPRSSSNRPVVQAPPVTPQKSRPSRSTRPPKTTPPAINTSQPANATEQPSREPSHNPGAAKNTKALIRIGSNVSSARILISGIIAGNVNTPIEVDPGDLELEVSAKGYVTRQVKLSAVKGKETALTVDLEVAKKPRPSPRKRKPSPAAAVAKDDDLFESKPNMKRQQPAENSYYLLDEFQRDQAYSRQASPSLGYAPTTSQPTAIYAPQASTPHPLISMLPLGAGQFQSGRYLVGTSLALVQLGTLYYGYQEYSQSLNKLKERDALVEKRNAAGEELTDEDFAWMEQKASESKIARRNASASGIVFFTLWLLGIADALVYDRDMMSAPRPARYYPTSSLEPSDEGGWRLSLTWNP